MYVYCMQLFNLLYIRTYAGPNTGGHPSDLGMYTYKLLRVHNSYIAQKSSGQLSNSGE